MVYFTPNPEDYQIFDPIQQNWVFTIVILQIIILFTVILS